MIQRTRAALVATALAVALVGSGCFFLVFYPIADPGGMFTITGSITDTDPVYARLDEDCQEVDDEDEGELPPPMSAGDHYYDAYIIRNDTGADRRITVRADWGMELGTVFLYYLPTTYDPQIPGTPAGVGLPVVQVPAGSIPNLPHMNPPGFDPSNVSLCIIGNTFGESETVSLLSGKIIRNGESLVVVATSFSSETMIPSYEIKVSTE